MNMIQALHLLYLKTQISMQDHVKSVINLITGIQFIQLEI